MTDARARLRTRFPTIVAEAVSVVFAVLFALTVDEWWEERENVALAERMTDAIAREIGGNRAELRDAEVGRGPAVVVAALDSAIAAFRAGDEPEEVGVDWSVALLSSAAWDAAQVSRATQYMEPDRLIELARLYELQRLYADRQDRLVSLIADIPSGIESAPVETLVSLRSHVAVMLELRGTLETIYGCVLAEREGARTVEAGACFDGSG